MVRPIARALDYFRTGPDRPVFSSDPGAVRRVYERWRWSVFLSVTIGYGLFYVCRINLSVVKKPLLDEGVMSPTELGLAGSALFLAYAVGKACNGILADRANVRRFMSAALLCSAAVNLVLGLELPFVAFVALWWVNGWFQSIGSAPSVVALSHWFSRGERGTRYGIWSTSHSLGEGITFVLTATLVGALDWRWGFWGPGLLCAAGALVLGRTLADRPQTLGLPHVSVYRNEPDVDVARQDAPLGTLQAGVLRMPAVWLLGLSSCCMYVARYGINSWGVLYLQEAKGYSLEGAGGLLAVSPVAGLVGSVLCGWVSDRFFGGRRNVPALLCGLAEIASLAALRVVPAGHPWLDGVALAVFGVAMGGLVVFIGGLMAADIVPQRAVGATMGLVGMFSYSGAAVQDSVSGWLLQNGRVPLEAGGAGGYDFDGVFAFWIGASVLSALLALGVWSAKPGQ